MQTHLFSLYRVRSQYSKQLEKRNERHEKTRNMCQVPSHWMIADAKTMWKQKRFECTMPLLVLCKCEGIHKCSVTCCKQR